VSAGCGVRPKPQPRWGSWQGRHHLRRGVRHGRGHGAQFAREGSKVVIGDVMEHEGRQVADAIGASARFEPLDVTKE
jgi:hypothetical protein